MKKLIAIFTFIFITFISLSSCNKKDNNYTDVNKDKIQLWYYYEENSSAQIPILKIVNKAEEFCDKNNIPLEIFKYSSDVLSHKDYVLKRNLSASFGNMIIIEDINSIRDLSKHHADYTKIISYNNLLDSYKNRFCIPFGTICFAMYIENEAMKYYEINPDKRLITYTDYLEIKQNMKEKGANFELNQIEYQQLSNYYQYKNGLLFIDEKSEAMNDKNVFKKSLKDAIIGMHNDIFTHYNIDVAAINNPIIKDPHEESIYDKNSGLVLQYSYKSNNSYRYLTDDYDLKDGIEDFSNKTFFMNPMIHYYSPNFFMHEKITNDRIYELASYIVNDDTYRLINDGHDLGYINYMPIFNTDITRKTVNVTDELEFVGNEYGGVKEIKEIKNNFYKMLLQDSDESKEIAEYHLFNRNYQSRIEMFIIGQVKEIINYYFNKDISLDKIENENNEINKMIDEKINEYIDNFHFYE